MSVNVAIAGATGAVGQEFLNVLAERKFPIKSLKLLASARSAGKSVDFAGKSYIVEELTKDSFKGVQIAFFSAGVSAALGAPSAAATFAGFSFLGADFSSAMIVGKGYLVSTALVTPMVRRGPLRVRALVLVR